MKLWEFMLKQQPKNILCSIVAAGAIFGLTHLIKHKNIDPIIGGSIIAYAILNIKDVLYYKELKDIKKEFDEYFNSQSL